MKCSLPLASLALTFISRLGACGGAATKEVELASFSARSAPERKVSAATALDAESARHGALSIRVPARASNDVVAALGARVAF